MTLGSETVTITASIGVAFFPADGEDSQSLLKAADSAMYHAKGEGRNGLAFYADDMSDRASERLAIDQGLRVALASSQLALHFQPVVELGTGRVVGAEVLLRWHHPVHGMISPARFIPVAEQSSLIEQIGAWVLDAAVRQAREWDAQGLHPFRLAVNVSTRQFVRDGFEKVVRDVIARHGMPNGGLELEITESALQAVDRSRPLLLALRQLGVQLAIDDFGTGFSSLSLLQHLPIDRLKIDRSFISALSERSSSLAIVRAVVGLGHTLGLRVVAEGVETTQQLALLRHTGCEDAQGYYVCHPLPADQFAAWLRGRRV
jgi:EAL domain-containing protein (putative c-di-GMP-specific phosphodiesterase class I)